MFEPIRFAGRTRVDSPLAAVARRRELVERKHVS